VKEKEIQAKRYKPSKYNFFFDADDGTHLAFNAISGAFAKINNEDFLTLHRLLQNDKTIVVPSMIKRELFDDLLKGRFIIDDEEDELDFLKVNNRIERFSTNSTLSLTILPTLSCNFGCKYCYTAKRNDQMNNDIQDRIIKMVESKCKYWKALEITWLGGEPLLAFETMETLTHNFLNLCSSRDIRYSAGLITNGYFLTPSICTKLIKEMKINFIQITLDGPQDIHDKRRPLKSGEGTFDTVFSNLKNVLEFPEIKNVNIVVRINIDKNNAERCDQLIDILSEKGFSNKITLSPAAVQSMTSGCQDIEPLRFTPFEFYKGIHLKFIQKALKCGFHFNVYPKLVGSSCVADRLNAYVVAPDGLLYKCWNDPGFSEESIGFIDKNGNIKHNKKIIKWLAYDPFEVNECRECKFLPICGGGCVYKRLKGQCDVCGSWKYNLKDILNFFYLLYQAKTMKGGDKNDIHK